MSQKRTYHFLVSLLQPFRWIIAGTVLLAAALVLANVGLLSVSAVLISLAALQPHLLDLMVYIVGVRFFGISRALLRYSERYISHKITFEILTSLRTRVYQHIEPAAPAGLQYYSDSQLFDRLLNDIDVLKYFYLRAVLAPAAALVVLTVCSIVLAQFSMAAMILLVSLFVLFGIVVPLAMSRFTAKPAVSLAAEREQWQLLLEDYLSGLSELKNSGQETAYCNRMLERLQRMAALERCLGIFGNVTSSLLQYGSNLSLALSLLVVIPSVAQGSLNGVYSAMVLLMIWSSFEAIQPFPQALIQLQQSLEAANHLLDLPQITPATEKQQQHPDDLDIDIQHIQFAYENGTQVYADFSLFCPQGAHIALVGTSGSGKSTLGWLMVRFWEPQQGQINLGNIPLKQYPEQQLRDLIGIVEQDTFLFSATIKENLLLACSHASPLQLQQALAFACLDDVIAALPEGLQTYLGDDGYRLSGGQRQRLALARAWLRDCPVVVLDEVFQGLDSITAGRLRDNLEQWGQGRTMLYISHSMQHLQKIDRIYVLEKGQIVEQGTADELLHKKNSRFYRMWELERQQIAVENNL